MVIASFDDEKKKKIAEEALKEMELDAELDEDYDDDDTKTVEVNHWDDDSNYGADTQEIDINDLLDDE